MEPPPLYISLFGLGTMLGLLVCLRLRQRLLGASVHADLNQGNAARAMLQVGQVFGVFLVASAAVKNGVKGGVHHAGVGADVVVVSACAVIALVLLMVTGHFGIRALLGSRLPAELARGNTAAGVAAGVSIAVAVIVARALEGDFVSWGESLKGYGGVLLFLLALYPVRQVLVQVVLLGAPFTLRGGRLDAGVAAERNNGMGALEAVTYLATAFAIAELA